MEQTAKVIDITETQAIESKALALPEKARLIVVDSSDGMTMADDTVNVIDAMIKEIDGTFQPMANKAHLAHKAITTKWAEIKQPLTDAKSYLVSQVKQYKIKLREAAEAEEKRLREIALKEEEDRRMKEAEQAEKEGNHEEAEAIIQEEIYVPPPVVKVEMPKVNNTKYRVMPRARIINKMDVIKAVAMNPALQDLIDINQSAANNKAKALGKSLDATIKGLQYYED